MDFEEELLSPLRGPSPPASVSEPFIDPLTMPPHTSGSHTDDEKDSNSGSTVPNLIGMVGKIQWIGGPPNADFTQLIFGTPATPLCFRGLDTSSEIRGYVKRTEGLSTKFKRDDPEFPLVAFADEALKHMQQSGMDTVFYMKGMNSQGTGEMELFTYHTQFTKQQVQAHVTKMIDGGNFGELHTGALKESATWLSNSKPLCVPSWLNGPLALFFG